MTSQMENKCCNPQILPGCCVYYLLLALHLCILNLEGDCKIRRKSGTRESKESGSFVVELMHRNITAGFTPLHTQVNRTELVKVGSRKYRLKSKNSSDFPS